MAKKKIPFIHYQVTKIEDYENITSLITTKKKIFDRLIESVKEGIEQNKQVVPIFKIYNPDQILNLEKEKWQDALKNAILFYTDLEDYEKCIECKRIIEKLN